MTSEEAVLSAIKALSPEKQELLLDFANFLLHKTSNSIAKENQLQQYDLNDLLSKVTPDNLHHEIDSGYAVGVEIG
jgi:hypothetical protein